MRSLVFFYQKPFPHPLLVLRIATRCVTLTNKQTRARSLVRCSTPLNRGCGARGNDSCFKDGV
jgi:hypothetical protein